MKFELEASDINAIVDRVMSRLTPVLCEIKETGKEMVQLQNSTPAKPPASDLAIMSSSAVLDSFEVSLLVGLSRTTIWRQEKKGEFPQRRKLSGNRVGWLRVEVEQWLAARLKL